MSSSRFIQHTWNPSLNRFQHMNTTQPGSSVNASRVPSHKKPRKNLLKAMRNASSTPTAAAASTSTSSKSATAAHIDLTGNEDTDTMANTKNKNADSKKSQTEHASKRRRIGKAEKEEAPSFSTPQQLIRVKVGKEGSEFPVYRQYLTHHSPVFKAMLEGGFMESGSDVVTLEEADPETFGRFMEWIYGAPVSATLPECPCSHPQKFLEPDGPGKFKLMECGKDKTCNVDATRCEIFAKLAKLWALADYLMMPKLQNTIIDVIDGLRPRGRNANIGRVMQNTIWGITVLSGVCNDMNRDSALGKYVVGLMCCVPSPDAVSWEQIWENLSPDLHFYLTEQLKSMADKRVYTRLDRFDRLSYMTTCD